ncbi:helix-turn-helix domain-containing protein [Corynebacterium sp. USCH3]|uniref:helix-turn-helix transcriptional regulator n=1 Tax=Corynebacterium sp. USCH3 TaxID=3024840 RepID=UPI0030B0D547
MSASIGVARAAALLGISRQTAYTAIANGDFPTPAFKIGGRYIVPVAPLAEKLGITPAQVVGDTAKSDAA